MTCRRAIAFAIILLFLTACATDNAPRFTPTSVSTSSDQPVTTAVQSATPTPIATSTPTIIEPSATPSVVESWWKAELPAEIVFRHGEDTIDGGVLLLGRRMDTYPSQEILLKLNQDGTLDWAKTFEVEQADFHTVHETEDGRILLAGLVETETSHFSITLELNLDGGLLSQQSYRFFGGARIVQRDGKTVLEPIGQTGFTTVSEEMGETEWEITSPQPDGGAIHAGSTWKTFTLSQGGTHCCRWPGLWIYRVDDEGIVMWQKLYQIDLVGSQLRYLATSDGGVAIAGSQHTGRWTAWIAKIDPDGILQFWRYHAIDGYEVYGFTETPDGGFLILARRQALKLNADGDLVWSRTSPSIGIYDYMYERTDGSLLLASTGGPGSRTWISHISSEGEIPGCEDYLGGEGLVAEQPLDPPPDTGRSLKVIKYIQEATPDTDQIAVVDATLAAHTLCSAPFPTPVPLGQDSPTPSLPRADVIYPILVGRQGLILGGVKDGTWLDALSAAEGVLDGERYVMVYTNDWPGEATGGEPTALQDEACGSVLSVPLAPRRGGALTFALASPWEAFPRTPLELPTDSSIYRNAVHAYLEEHGLEDQPVTFEEVWRIDLEGDGTDEVLINASARSSGSGVRSWMVLLRKVVGDSVETFSLGEALFDPDHPGQLLPEFSIYAMADLNGDGAMEVLVEGERQGWSELTVFATINDAVAPVLKADCLPPVP